MRLLKSLAFALSLLLAALAPARAGVMTPEAMKKFFPFPYIVGQKDEALPVWPIFKQNATSDELVAYVFETADLAPIPGFSGGPINMLVALQPDGSFGAVQLLEQHEPVFVDGLGEEPLIAFIKQYEGKSLKQNIKIGTPANKGDEKASANAYIDGVAKATASVRVVNESMLAAALQVARAKLGYAPGVDPSRVVRPREDLFTAYDLKQLEERGFVRHYRVTNREVEAAFAGSDGAGLDPEAKRDPDGIFIDLTVAYINAPSIGRNLYGEANFKKLLNQMKDGEQAFLLISSGRYSVFGDDFVPGAVLDRVALRQSDLPIDGRDQAFRRSPNLAGLPQGEEGVLKIFAAAGFDPSRPAQFSVHVTREKGIVYPERFSRAFAFDYTLPGDLFILPEAPEAKGWRAIWVARAQDCALLVASLALLAFVLARQKMLTRSPVWFERFRYAFLAYTLVFIGWVWQGQLSIVNLIGVIKGVKAHFDFGFFLYDPPTLILWAFVLLTVVFWGRGPFCGWLCPFGALQELVALVAKWLKIRQVAVPPQWDRRLRLLKYAALALILGVCIFSEHLAEYFADIEPFKTAITLVFVRSWPFVLYAVGLIVLNLFIYKGFCRYLCPLGASLALIGKARRWDWIARRAECGSPCQLCAVRCRYGAIEKSGKVDYDECFQCMDCVVIFNDERQCVPLVLAAKAKRRAQA